MVPPERLKTHSLALFSHAPISELVYFLSGAKVSNIAHETYSISGGDTGWERWHALNSNTTVYRILNLSGADAGGASDEDEEDYDEPDEGTGSKKRRPKAPRGGAKQPKKQKKAAASKTTRKTAASSNRGTNAVAGPSKVTKSRRGK
ncbi:hypothetical protein C8R46DRAFT_1210556 [Mycena filopes]|nr:hypothetical protein C8R46DRAFT_1210556 [Mycena filopes]